MHIRPFTPDDAAALAAVFQASVRGLGARHYAPAQVSAWCRGGPDAAAFRHRAHTHRVLVAVCDRSQPVAYADMEADGHIDHLYCLPAYAGRGVGSALLAALLAGARQSRLPNVHVEASAGARGLFARHGFALDRRADVMVGGVAIHHYCMSRALT